MPDRDATLKQAEKLLRQGKLDAAIAEYVRLVQDHPRDWTSINALGDLYVRAGDLDRAVAQFTQVADFMFAEGFVPKAAALYKKALKVKPTHEPTLRRLAEIAGRQGLLVDARNYLQQLDGQRRDGRADPDLLLVLGRTELASGRVAEARTAFTRMMAAAPDRWSALLDLAGELARAGSAEHAFLCAEVVVDDAVLAGDWDRAIAALESLIPHGASIPALVKLVEVAVDAGREDAMQNAQAQLADAYMRAGRTEEARVIAEDLVARNPHSEMHADRLRRALAVLGVDDAEHIIERYREPVDDVSRTLAGDDELLPLERTEDASPPPAEPGPATAPLRLRDEPLDEDDAIVLDQLEIDLSDALADLGAPTPGDPPPPDLDGVFEQMRARAAQQSGADGSADYERALQRLEAGDAAEAIGALRAAARAPLFRFRASARLGRLLIARGDVAEGIEWLERAAEAPAPTAEEGWSLLYDLADALERAGESARALAVLLEIEADAGTYRDARERIELLSRAQAGKA